MPDAFAPMKPSTRNVGASVDRVRYYRADPRHPIRIVPVEDDAAGEADLAAAAIHGAFRAFVDDAHHPCVGAKSALHGATYRLGVYDELASPRSTGELARALASFVADPELIASDYATFVAAFESPREAEPAAFEALLWSQLQRLHREDDAPWDDTVSSDPEDPRFSFSFAGKAFYVIGMSPHSERIARRFPWPVLVFNPHAQFERLRASDRWSRMKEVIRARDTDLQGQINPSLEDFGARSEACQYAGREVEPGWRAPFRARHAPNARPTTATTSPLAPRGCPFHAKKAG
jgi:FPC/CPF motif-containing protein YcgG